MRMFTAKLPAKSPFQAGIAGSYDNREDHPDTSFTRISSKLLKSPLAQTSTEIMKRTRQALYDSLYKTKSVVCLCL